MVVAEYFGIGTGLVLCFLGVWKVASTTKTKVSYKSFDRNREASLKTFTNKEVCEIKHTNIDTQLKGIHEKLDRLLYKNGV